MTTLSKSTGFIGNKVQALGYEVYSVASKLYRTTATEQSQLPIILIHGAIVSHLYWMPTAKLLAKDHDVYAIDLPGHGKSSKPAKTLTVIEQAEVIAEWLAVMGIEKAVIAGNSYGCEIAVELAIKFSDRVGPLILTAPAADPSEPTIHQQGLRLLRDAFFENPTMGFVLLRDSFSIGIKRGLETSQIMIDYDYIPRLPLVMHKTLVVRGSKDTVAPEPWVEKVVKLLPDAQLVVIPGGPHDINYSNPKELSAAMNVFLSEP
jgi:pimeloyl-ACP methyl ester carboxylesterase